MREKRTQPRAIMQRIPPQLALQTVANAEQSPFFAPFTRFTDSIGEADRARLSAAGRELRLSPAVVSSRITKLEARLGVRLLNRMVKEHYEA